MAFPTKADQDAKAQHAVYEADKERGLQEIYRAFPVIPRNTANDKMLDEICATFLGVQVGEVAPTLPTFRSAVEADPSLLGSGSSGVSIEPVEQQKRKVLGDIERLLDGIMSPFDLRTEIKKLSFQTLQQVQARRAQIIERQRLVKLPSSQIKQELKASRPKALRYPPYENLGEYITPRGSVQSVRCDSAYLLNLVKTNFYEYRYLVDRFGSAQITARQQGRD
jgi:hypothetical protein